jgi:ribosome-associated translation inhibitor RaiA
MSNSQVQVTFHGIDHSDPLEALIQEKAAKLRSMHTGLQKVRVVVDVPHRSHLKGNAFEVKVELLVEGDELVISRELDADHARDAPYALVRETFNAAQRVLIDHADRRSGAAERHRANNAQSSAS